MKVIDRHLEPSIRDLLKVEPVVVVDGPRTAGKSFAVQTHLPGRIPLTQERLPHAMRRSVSQPLSGGGAMGLRNVQGWGHV